MHDRAIKLRLWPVINICSPNVSESLRITTEDKNIILKAYSTQKVGAGGNFESGNQGYGRRQIQTHEKQMVYLMKLTHQKDANHNKIAIKIIQLSSHIIKHDEFIETTFSSEIFLETNSIFVIRGKKPLPISLPAWREETQWCQIYAMLQQNKFQDQTVFMKNLFLE